MRDHLEPKQQWSLGQKARTVYTELSGMANLLQFAIVSWDLFMLWEYRGSDRWVAAR